MIRGFQFAETMSGTYALVASPDVRRPLSFSIHARVDSLVQYLRTQRAVIEGTLTAEGLAEQVPVQGTMIIAPVSRRLIRYELNFTGDDGRPYTFAGQKDIKPLRPLRTMTELPAEIHDAQGRLVATSVTHFGLRSELIPFLASWRPV